MDIHEAKLRVLYVPPPQPPSPITESNEEEGLSPKTSPVVDNGDRHFAPNDLVKNTFLALFILSLMKINLQNTLQEVYDLAWFRSQGGC